MNFNFPYIETIDDVLPYIKGREEFFVADKGDYQIINYTHQASTTFPPVSGPNDLTNIMLRECRGITFDKDRRIISRPFHKFFNLGEKPECDMPSVARELSYPHFFLEKLDGSMVRPFHLGDPDLYQMATKMGFTDTSAQVDRFLKETVDLSSNDRTIHDLIMDCHDAGYTPIFEWCSRKNKIVLDYPQDRLVLIALREMRSGKYYPYDEMLDIAHHNNVDVVRFYKGNIKTIEEMVDDIRQTDDEEGYVLSWENGHKVKIKSDWYVLLHKSKDSIRQEKDVLELILTDKSDDLLPLLDDADKAKIIDYRNSVWEALNIASHSYGSFVTQAKAENVTMKEFALSWVPQLAVPSIAFNIFRGKMNAHDAVVDYCLKQCSSNKKVEALHKFLDIYKKFRYEEKIGE